MRASRSALASAVGTAPLPVKPPKPGACASAMAPRPASGLMPLWLLRACTRSRPPAFSTDVAPTRACTVGENSADAMLAPVLPAPAVTVTTDASALPVDTASTVALPVSWISACSPVLARRVGVTSTKAKLALMATAPAATATVVASASMLAVALTLRLPTLKPTSWPMRALLPTSALTWPSLLSRVKLAPAATPPTLPWPVLRLMVRLEVAVTSTWAAPLMRTPSPSAACWLLLSDSTDTAAPRPTTPPAPAKASASMVASRRELTASVPPAVYTPVANALVLSAVENTPTPTPAPPAPTPTAPTRKSRSAHCCALTVMPPPAVMVVPAATVASVPCAGLAALICASHSAWLGPEPLTRAPAAPAR